MFTSLPLIVLNKNKLTKSKVNAVICAVAVWQNTAELLRAPGNMDRVKSIQVELERLLEELGGQLLQRKKRKTASTRRHSLLSLIV